LASPPASSANIVDLFGADGGAQPQAQSKNALDDLLQLGNPFADMFGAQPPVQQQPANNQWMSNGEHNVFIFTIVIVNLNPLLL
jgi:hypothetical protein